MLVLKINIKVKKKVRMVSSISETTLMGTRKRYIFRSEAYFLLNMNQEEEKYEKVIKINKKIKNILKEAKRHKV